MIHTFKWLLVYEGEQFQQHVSISASVPDLEVSGEERCHWLW